MSDKQSSKWGLFVAGPLGGVGITLLLAIATITLDTGCHSSRAGMCRALAPALAAANKWQSLLGAVLALVAAILSAWFIFEQILLSDGQEKSRVQRRWRAQRALMPMVMSRVCDYAEQSAEQLRVALGVAQHYEFVSGDRVDLQEPVLDPEVVSSIVAMIEAAQDGEADAYVDLLNELQVHMARWRGFIGDLRMHRSRRIAHDIEEELVEASELYARASNLLAAARPLRMAEGRPMTRRGGLLLLGLNGGQFEGAKTLADAYDDADPLTAPVRPRTD